MTLSNQRPHTPPPSRLLTPPPTGGFDKGVRFSRDKKLGSSTNPTAVPCPPKSIKGESLADFFEDSEEGLDTEIDETSDDRGGFPSGDKCSPTSPVSAPPTTTSSDLDQQSSVIKTATNNHLSTAIKSPFPFMKLPLSIRSRIYTYLLVIPALICVRQNHTTFHDEPSSFLSPPRRELRPGIASALAQLTVHGPKIPISHFRCTNIAILRASTQTHTEATPLLYRKNTFAIPAPAPDLSPPPNFSTRLFPRPYQHLVAHLSIRTHSFHALAHLLATAHTPLKTHFRGLASLTLLLQLHSLARGFARHWAPQPHEVWAAYVARLHGGMARELYPQAGQSARPVPRWMRLRVLFAGEAYVRDEHEHEHGRAADDGDGLGGAEERSRRDEVRRGLGEAWDMLGKRERC